MELPPSWVTDAVEAESFPNLTPQMGECVNLKTPEVNPATVFIWEGIAKYPSTFLAGLGSFHQLFLF